MKVLGGICLLALLAICPPDMPPVEMTRETVDGVTYSEGTYDTATRYMHPRYYDNRTIVDADRTFWSQGVVTMAVGQFYSNGTRRLLKYRFEVDMPPYTTYHVIKNDIFPFTGKDNVPYDVCYEEGKLVFNTEVATTWGSPRTVQWDFEVYFEPIGDINGDGVVDGQDVALLLAAWGSDDPAADLNEDGIVDGGDLGMLFGAWSQY